MLSVNSPFLNIPVALDRKQAVFLDGMRHTAQIVDMSYRRLCQALTHIALGETSSGFAHVFLDTWALIDAADRFRSLWELQPNAATIPYQYSPSALRSRLQDIRNVRNVSAHIAQKIDQIVSLNSSVLGAISWVSLLSHAPLKVKTYLSAPGSCTVACKVNSQCQQVARQNSPMIAGVFRSMPGSTKPIYRKPTRLSARP